MRSAQHRSSWLFATLTEKHNPEWRGTLGAASSSKIDIVFESMLRYILPVQMAPTMNSATANKAETIITSKLSKVLRDMFGLHSLPSQVFIPHANEVARMAGVGR